jgi:hypothetical protein
MTYPMHEARFQIGDISTVAGVPGNTIRSWLQRGHLVARDEDRAAEANGKPAFFSGLTALQAAIMGALTNLGLHVTAASRAAVTFTHFGEGAGGFSSDPDVNNVRDPGAYFDNADETLLVVRADGEHTQIVPVRTKQTAGELLSLLVPAPFLDRPLVVLPMTALVDRVRVHLEHIAAAKARGGKA